MSVEPLSEHTAPITPAPASRTSDLWWKNGIICCLDVEKFMDGNGDGVGDFVGLTRKVDYLAGLGVTCLWLMPLCATPNRDDGYDGRLPRSIRDWGRWATSSTSCARRATAACAS